MKEIWDMSHFPIPSLWNRAKSVLSVRTSFSSICSVCLVCLCLKLINSFSFLAELADPEKAEVVILDALVKSSFIQRSPLLINWATFLPILKCLHCYRRARRLILWSWCFSHPNEEEDPLFTTSVSKYGLLAVTVANESADPLLPTDFYCLVLSVQRFDRTTDIDLSSTKHSSLYLLATSVYPTTYPTISYCHYITSPWLLTSLFSYGIYSLWQITCVPSIPLAQTGGV